MSRFQPHHIVTMVVAVCAATVLSPAMVSAVSTTAQTLFDANGTQAAAVNANGALKIDATGSGAGAFSPHKSLTRRYGAVELLSINANATVGISELDFAMVTTRTNSDVGVDRIRLEVWRRTSGSADCATALATVNSPTGVPSHFTVSTLREFAVQDDIGTQVVSFPVTPLLVPPSTSSLNCLGVHIVGMPDGTTRLTASLVGFRVS